MMGRSPSRKRTKLPASLPETICRRQMTIPGNRQGNPHRSRSSPHRSTCTQRFRTLCRSCAAHLGTGHQGMTHDRTRPLVSRLKLHRICGSAERSSHSNCIQMFSIRPKCLKAISGSPSPDRASVGEASNVPGGSGDRDRICVCARNELQKSRLAARRSRRLADVLRGASSRLTSARPRKCLPIMQASQRFDARSRP